MTSLHKCPFFLGTRHLSQVHVQGCLQHAFVYVSPILTNPHITAARRNGQLRYDDPDLLLNNAARAKVQKHREGYSASDLNKAFLPALVSTSGRIHGEFLRLLYIPAHRQTVTFFETLGRSRPLKPLPGAAPNTSFTTARL